MNGSDKLFELRIKLEPDGDYRAVSGELNDYLERGRARFAWIQLERANGAIAALVHRPVGWLQFYQDDYASSFHSVNPEYGGPEDTFTDYLLDNGQVDVYPQSWDHPLEMVVRALEHFMGTGERAPFIVWEVD